MEFSCVLLSWEGVALREASAEPCVPPGEGDPVPRSPMSASSQPTVGMDLPPGHPSLVPPHGLLAPARVWWDPRTPLQGSLHPCSTHSSEGGEPVICWLPSAHQTPLGCCFWLLDVGVSAPVLPELRIPPQDPSTSVSVHLADRSRILSPFEDSEPVNFRKS